MTLRLWGRRSAFNVQKALWGIGELELGCDQREVGGAVGGLDTPEFLALNPHGRIPVLEDGPLVVWESHTILRYLAASYGAGRLWPESAAARSQGERWMDWAQTTLQPDFMALFWGFYRTPEPLRDARANEGARRRCEAHFRLLDRELAARDFLGGDRFGLGDIPAGAALFRYFEMGAAVHQPRHVLAWYARLCERPAYREHVMRPFGELYGRTTF